MRYDEILNLVLLQLCMCVKGVKDESVATGQGDAERDWKTCDLDVVAFMGSSCNGWFRHSR